MSYQFLNVKDKLTYEETSKTKSKWEHAYISVYGFVRRQNPTLHPAGRKIKVGGIIQQSEINSTCTFLLLGDFLPA